VAQSGYGSKPEILTASRCFPLYTLKADIRRTGWDVRSVPISDIFTG
jgi:hypothetical protein